MFAKRRAPVTKGEGSAWWRRNDLRGLESARLQRTTNGWLLSGTSAFEHAHSPCLLNYQVRCDEDWHTRLVLVDGWVDQRFVHHQIAVKPNGRWIHNGTELAQLDGCIDIDLNFSPSTNTLPIRRLCLAVGASSKVRAAWLRFPDFTLHLAEQSYTRIATNGYEYRNGKFESKISVDSIGLVRHYPPAWEPLTGTADDRRTAAHGRHSLESLMRITVCQLPDRTADFERAWNRLAEHALTRRSDILVLPEMPFYPWPCDQRKFDPDSWRSSLSAHRAWTRRLGELRVKGVLSSMPEEENGRRFNTGVVWSQRDRVRFVHRKHFLPEMAGFFERTWFSRGLAQFESEKLAGAKAGFAICTELWAMDIARHYCKRGVHFLVTPRATGSESIDKWIAAGRTAAMIAGAFAVSSNRFSFERNFGGAGWIIAPDGEILGLTNEREPFVTVDCALAIANHAKSTYPRSALNLAQ